MARLLVKRLGATETVVAGPPATKEPKVGETLSHARSWPTVQTREAARLVKLKESRAGVTVPPTEPVNKSAEPGVISRRSGRARAEMRLLPIGEPQPVQRS